MKLKEKPWIIYPYLVSTVVRWLNLPLRKKVTTFAGDRIEVILNAYSYWTYGFIEQDLTEFIVSTLKPGDIFVDGGAHIGYYSTLAGRIVGPAGAVHAFEPTPYVFNILARNVAGRNNIIANQKALWSSPGMIEFYDMGPAKSSSNSCNYRARIGKPFHKIKVPTVTLDDYCLEKKIKPSLVKLDVEEAEYEVLKGMDRILTEDRPVIVMETLDWPEIENVYTNAIALLLKHNYQAYRWVNHGLVKHTPCPPYVYGNLIFMPN